MVSFIDYSEVEGQSVIHAAINSGQKVIRIVLTAFPLNTENGHEYMLLADFGNLQENLKKEISISFNKYKKYDKDANTMAIACIKWFFKELEELCNDVDYVYYETIQVNNLPTFKFTRGDEAEQKSKIAVNILIQLHDLEFKLKVPSQ